MLEKNKLYAKYRTNRAFVCEIYDKDIKENINNISSDRDNNFKYIVGQYIEEIKYDENINEICTSGIHFFLAEECAFF